MSSNYEMVDILLAEDSDADAEMTLRALRKSNIGNAVHRVRDGQEALDFLNQTGPYEGCTPARLLKLVLLDLKMPKIDGVEVLRKLRATEASRTLPVVIMTSSNEERDVTQSYLLGANSYVVKPIDFSQFAKTVVEVGLYWIVTNRVPG
ncbi:MAG TPA: response regulator [Casimicrobiaceae bacterium]|nr:response regulator [Casimicrobiaceae bacterium]